MSRRTVSDWRREVFRCPTLSDRAKVLLLFLAENMRADLKVSLPRNRIAAGLGRSERRVTERIAEAHEAGWLWTPVRGQKGVTAVYQGLFPGQAQRDTRPPAERPQNEPFSGTPTSPLNHAETRPLNGPKQAFSGTHGCPTITRADPSLAGSDRNVGRDEKAADPPAVSSRWCGATDDGEATA